MDYKARFYDPTLARFVQPDTIIPGYADPQSLSRYSYVLNDPIRFVDPSGHKVSCDDGPQSWKACSDQLEGYATNQLKKKGRKDDLGAMVNIINKAAQLYGNYQDMMPELSGIFIGLKESNPLTLLHAASASGCAGVGRDPIDCKANGKSELFFADAGFNKNFQDTHNQLYHLWAYVTTAASTDGPRGGFVAGRYVGMWGNAAHEIAAIGEKANGATWQDYALAEAGMRIGTRIALGTIPARQLGSYVQAQIGTTGPGAPYVDLFNQYIPLSGSR